MALIDITPIMTSNTTPSPYAVYTYLDYNSNNKGWKAFDGNVSSSDGWLSGGVTGSIKLDFGVITSIDAFSVYSRGVSTQEQLTECPNTFILYGSNDNIIFEQIIEISDQILWNPSEGRLFKLSSKVSYRYYRISISKNNGHSSYVGIGEIKFWQDDGVQPEPITNSKASLNYCLPKNSTFAMKQRSMDPREGLLGFANDPDNYGTLWMVDNKGKAMIPMASMANADILFNGVANKTNTAYTLASKYTDYKYILAIGGASNGTGAIQSLLIPTSRININDTNGYALSCASSSTSLFYISFLINGLGSFMIKSIAASNWTDPAITIIYGIK